MNPQTSFPPPASASSHLTEGQIDDHLIGDLDREHTAHLSACPECQARVAAATAPLSSFRELSLAWAERRSATLPLRPEATSHQRPRVLWATTAAAALALAIALPSARERFAAVPASTAAATSPTADVTSPSASPSVPAPAEAPVAPAPQALAALGHTGIKSVTPVAATAKQIARDNEMLEQIDRELAAPADPPATYGLETVADSSDPRGPAPAMRD